MKNLFFLAIVISSLVYEGQADPGDTADTKCCCCGGARRGMNPYRMSEGTKPNINYYILRSSEMSDSTTDQCDSQQGKCTRLMTEHFQAKNQEKEDEFAKIHGKRENQLAQSNDWKHFYPAYELRTVKSLAVEVDTTESCYTIKQTCGKIIPEQIRLLEKDLEEGGDLDESKSESKSQSVDSDGAEEVKQWLKLNRIKYDAEKFVEEIDSLADLTVLESKDIVMDFFPDMKLADRHKILKAVRKMTQSPKPQSRFRSSQAALSPVEA